MSGGARATRLVRWVGYRLAQARRVRFESALGSAYEVRAALHIAWRFGYIRQAPCEA